MLKSVNTERKKKVTLYVEENEESDESVNGASVTVSSCLRAAVRSNLSHGRLSVDFLSIPTCNLNVLDYSFTSPSNNIIAIQEIITK
jgi:hypothetical protein